MPKSKVAFFMKSDFSFDRLKTTFSVKVYREKLEIYPDNMNTYDDFDDLLDLWTPELIVLDSKLSELERMEDLAKGKEIDIIVFNSDYDVLTEQINIHFQIQEQTDEEESTDINYIKTDAPEKVIVQDRIIEKEIIRTEYTAMTNTVIVVSSLWQGAGSTTFGTNLARAISERGIEVAYVEFPLIKPYMFDYLSIPIEEDNRGREKYIDVSKEIRTHGKRLSKKATWKQSGVNWFVQDTRKEPFSDFRAEELLKLVYSVNSVVTIVDISTHLDNQEVQKFLNYADHIFVCLEPDPVKIDWLATVKEEGKRESKQRRENEVINFLNGMEEKEDVSYQFITMKHSNRINKNEWIPYLEKTPIAYFPSLPYEDLNYSVWKSTFIYDDEKYNEIIEKAFRPVIAKVLPRNLYNIKEQKKKSVFNLFKKERVNVE